MDVGENGQEMSAKDQKICWYSGEVLSNDECSQSWSCLAKRYNTVLYNNCVTSCINNKKRSGELERYESIQADLCPSRQAFCAPDKTDYKNFMLQQGVIKWGYDTGFNSFSYCCYPGAAFFRDDYNIEALRSYGIYVDIRGDPHIYKENRRLRDDWIGKNMQYLIGRTGLFKHYQGK